MGIEIDHSLGCASSGDTLFRDTGLEEISCRLSNNLDLNSANTQTHGRAQLIRNPAELTA